MTVPEDGSAALSELDAGGAVFPPLVPLAARSLPVEPAPDPQELQRAATAQRNKDAFARLGRKVAGATRSAADTTGAAAREAAARTGETAGAVRDQVANRVSEITEPAAGPRPVRDGVVVAGGPGLPVGTGSVTLRPAATLGEDVVVIGEGSDGPKPTASSVVIQPVGGSSGAGVQHTVRDAGDRAAGAAREASDRAAAAAAQAAAAGRQAAEAGQQAAAVAGSEVTLRAQQAGVAAQRAGAAAQQAGAAAVTQTRTALGDAVAGGQAAVRERTAPPIDLEGLAAQVVALPGVARLASDAAGRGRGLLPGQVAGAQVSDDTVTVRVVARYGTRLPDLADRIHELAARYAEGRQTVVEIPALDVAEHDRDPQHNRDRHPDPSTSTRGTS